MSGVPEFYIPVAAVVISKEQARCAIDRYCKAKNLVDTRVEPIYYENLDALSRTEGLEPSDLLILTDDDRGKCIAYQPCGEAGAGRCRLEYYDCGCFV